MARKAASRGGYRVGTPGRQYGNRTDLNLNRGPVKGLATPASGGIRTPTGDVGAPPPPPTGPVGGPPGISPDDVTPLDAPSQRPDVPVTAGLPSGPGPGPEVMAGLPNPATQQWRTGKDLVSGMAADPNASPALRSLAANLGIGL